MENPISTNAETKSPVGPRVKVKEKVTGFVGFVREQGVIGLAIGIILGGAVRDVVTALISDFISPILGLILGSAGNLKEMSFSVGTVTFMWGHFLATLIDFVVIASVVYFVIDGLLKRIDKPKS